MIFNNNFTVTNRKKLIVEKVKNYSEKIGKVATKNLVKKFGLSEKHSKFEKIFLMVLTNQLMSKP